MKPNDQGRPPRLPAVRGWGLECWTLYELAAGTQRSLGKLESSYIALNTKEWLYLSIYTPSLNIRAPHVASRTISNCGQWPVASPQHGLRTSHYLVVFLLLLTLNLRLSSKRLCPGWFLTTSHKPRHIWEEGISTEDLPPCFWPVSKFLPTGSCLRSCPDFSSR